MQEIPKTLKNCEEFVAKKQIEQDKLLAHLFVFKDLVRLKRGQIEARHPVPQ